MRILMLAQFYPPILGGEERHVKSLCDALTARGHNVAVATLGREGLPAYELDGETRIYRLRSSMQRLGFLYSETERPHAPPFPDLEVVAGLGRVLEQEQPQIVHAHNWMVYSYLPHKIRNRTPLVVTLHDYSLACAQKRLMRAGARGAGAQMLQFDGSCSGPGLLKCMQCSTGHYGALKGVPTYLGNRLMGALERQSADVYIAVSQATAEGNRLPQMRIPFQVIPNFVPNEFGRLTIYEHSLAEQLPEDGYLLFVGDLSRDKGVPVLLDAYSGMKNAPPLVLIGRPVAETPLALPENVLVFHSWPNSAVMAAWQRSVFGLVPSVWAEPFGIVALEAMAAGKPLIASNIGGLADIVLEGETGLLVPPGDPRSLRSAMQRLLSNPQEIAEMGMAAKRRVQQYTAERVVPQIEQVYREVLSIEGKTKQGDPVSMKGGYESESL